MALPVGYSAIPGGIFTPDGAQAPVTVPPFAMKRTPVTNAEYGALAKSLGDDRYVLLNHDFETGETQLVNRGSTPEAATSSPLSINNKCDFDRGDVLIVGSQILLKVLDNPSARYDRGNYRRGQTTSATHDASDRIFHEAAKRTLVRSHLGAVAWYCLEKVEDVLIASSRLLAKKAANADAEHYEALGLFSVAMQPAIGLTYFHSKSWCLLKSLERGGAYGYDLPTDLQYQYVASQGGTKEYGTETGQLHDASGRRLAHIGLFNGAVTTVRVDEPRYEQDLPFGVQTTGNIWRWTQMNPDFKKHRGDDFFCYGMHGGSVLNLEDYGRATFRLYRRPYETGEIVGLQPVVFPKSA